jgi:hypothetical protein
VRVCVCTGLGTEDAWKMREGWRAKDEICGVV